MSDEMPGMRKHASKWRGDKPDPIAERTNTRRARQLYGLVALVLAILGAGVAIVLYYEPMATASFLTLSVREYESPLLPPNPWAVQDSHLLAERFRIKEPGYASQSRDHFDKVLKGFETLSCGVVVVHVCALARVHNGQVFLLPGDANPDDSGRWIALKEVIEKVGRCPAKHRLLLLDVARPLADPRLGILSDNVSDMVHVEVESSLAELDKAVPAITPFFVLTACGPGQRSHVSEEMQCSAFAYYLDQGLRGQAEGVGPHGRGDQRVFVQELAHFVKEGVNRWASHNRGQGQTPHLYGRAEDFALVQLSQDPAPTAERVEVKYPDWLRSGWETRDKLEAAGADRKAPRIFRQLETEILRAEKRWRAGFEEPRLKRELTAEIEVLKGLMVRGQETNPPQPGSLAEIADPKVEETYGKHRRGLELYLLRSFEPGEKVTDANKAREEEVKKIKLELVEQFKKLPFTTGAAVIVHTTSCTPNLTAGKLLALHGLLQEIRQSATSDQRFVETVFLDRLKDLVERVQDNAWEWPTSTAYQAFKVVVQAQRVLAELGPDPGGLFPWNLELFKQGDALRRQGENSLFAGTEGAWKAAELNLATAGKYFGKIQGRIGILRDMQLERDRSLVHMTGWAPYLVAIGRVDPQDETTWKAGNLAALGLVNLLEKQDLDTLAGEPNALLQWRSSVAAWQRSMDSRVRRLKDRAAEGDAEDYRAIHALLESPRLAAGPREALWAAASSLGKKLHQFMADHDAGVAVGPPPVVRDDPTAREEKARAGRRVRISLELLALAPYERIDSLTTRAEPFLKSGDEKVEAALADEFKDIWSRKLPNQYRLLVKETPPMRADRLGRILPGQEAERLAGAEANLSFRNPTWAVHRYRRGQLFEFLRERYQTEAQDVAKQKSRHAPFYAERAQDFLRPPS